MDDTATFAPTDEPIADLLPQELARRYATFETKAIPPREEPADYVEYALGKTMHRCGTCAGFGTVGERHKSTSVKACPKCDGIGFCGVNGLLATICLPGSNEKQAVLAARCRNGMPNGLSVFLDNDARGDED